MVKRCIWLSASALLMFVLSGCGSEPAPSSEPLSYKDMKSMVIDILKTEDAQKALQESASALNGSDGTKLLSVQDQEQVRLAVKDTLVSPDYHQVIEQLMTDPRFAGEFAKAINKENKQIYKDLIKDPTYQADLIKVMKNPEMDKMILEVLGSTQYRKQVATIMQESLQSPIYRLEILDLLKTAVKEELKVKPTEKVEKAASEEDKAAEEESGDSGEGEDSGESEGMGESGGGSQ
ncbi:spore germination protein D [Paenibacillus phyllosphaerae]|uniref:Spore germination protein D n=1 Tax=Paenibacillus phyllosphaerae TaxID=274593 RepID=A0A7W5B522_9BACL|nr:spore germination lipoprotein GerD [Paenibacillus phyllosphaerae]MBB3114324.1 spore germination protein D [Paenibacillus phyllosphaerae]